MSMDLPVNKSPASNPCNKCIWSNLAITRCNCWLSGQMDAPLADFAAVRPSFTLRLSPCPQMEGRALMLTKRSAPGLRGPWPSLGALGSLLHPTWTFKPLASHPIALLDSPVHCLGAKLQSKGMVLLATPDLLNWIICE